MISTEQNEKIYEFGDFRLIPDEELLLHRGEPIALNPKSFAVLALLVEHHGHLVHKSEIIDRIWDGSFVEEGVVSKSVWNLRNALGDASKEKFIQTVPRRGYRFVAAVRVLNDPSSNGLSRPELVSTGYRLPILPEDDDFDRELISPQDGVVAVLAAETEDLRTDGSTESTVVSQKSITPVSGLRCCDIHDPGYIWADNEEMQKRRRLAPFGIRDRVFA